MDDKKLKTGTTTVGLVGKDGVVFAADKRATMGYLIASKTVTKIQPISDYIAMTIAGSVGDAQTLVKWMSVQIKTYEVEKETTMPVSAAASLLSSVLASNKYFPFWVQILIGGFDTKPHLFSVDMLGGMTEEKKTATGSGSPFAYGVIDTNYNEKKPVSDLVPIATKAVWAAMQRDTATGEFIDVFTITKKGMKRYSKEEITRFLNI